MRSFRFLHSADLHLGSPFQGVRTKLPAPWPEKLMQAAHEVFRRIVDVAVTEHVDFVTLAGDLFDANEVSMSVQFELHRGFERLCEAGIAVYVIHGNHDPLSATRPLSWPDNVHVFPAAPRLGPEGYIAHSHYVVLDATTRIQISGFSYGQPEIVQSFAPAFVRDEGVDFAIALYHGAIGQSGGALHANYCAASLQELKSRGFDVWALGHIHQPTVLNESQPLVFYPGVPQGRHIQETGALGCTVVDVGERGSVRWTRHVTSTVTWHVCEVSLQTITDVAHIPGRVVQRVQASLAKASLVRASLAQTPPAQAVVRLVLTGTTPFYAHLRDEAAWLDIFSEALAQNGMSAVIERIVNQTRPELDIDTVRQSSAFVGAFLRQAEELRLHPEQARTALSGWLEDVFHAGNDLDIARLSDEDVLSMVDEAERIVLGMVAESVDAERLSEHG